MTDSRLLICVPDGPPWRASMASVTSVADCNHKVQISAAGVGLLLTTPGLKTCCMFCIPPDDDTRLEVPEEIRQQYKEEMGHELTGNVIEMARVWTRMIQARNRHR